MSLGGQVLGLSRVQVMRGYRAIRPLRIGPETGGLLRDYEEFEACQDGYCPTLSHDPQEPD